MVHQHGTHTSLWFTAMLCSSYFFFVLPLTATPWVVPPIRACMSTTFSGSYGNLGCLASKCTCDIHMSYIVRYNVTFREADDTRDSARLIDNCGWLTRPSERKSHLHGLHVRNHLSAYVTLVLCMRASLQDRRTHQIHVGIEVGAGEMTQTQDILEHAPVLPYLPP